MERQRGEIDGYDEWVRGYGKTSGARYNRAIYAVVPVDGSSSACIVEYANDDSPVRHLKTDRCWQPRRLRGVKRAFVTASVTRFTRDHRSVNIVVGRTNDYPERRNERKKTVKRQSRRRRQRRCRKDGRLGERFRYGKEIGRF